MNVKFTDGSYVGGVISKVRKRKFQVQFDVEDEKACGRDQKWHRLTRHRRDHWLQRSVSSLNERSEFDLV